MKLISTTLFALFFEVSCAARHPVKTGPAPVRLAAPESAADRAIHEAKGQRYMISTQGRAATKAAQKMFRSGGNIIDAAVAASFAISVERPQSTGLGGGGFFVFKEAKTGRNYAIDFRERAPGLATRDMFLDANGNVVPRLSTDGILSVAVPGLVAGLIEIHQKFGKLPLKTLLEPAIELAENGLVVYPSLADELQARQKVLMRFPESRKIFLKANGEPYRIGDTLVQKDLGKTLRLIAKNGKAAFYGGPVEKAILKESKKLHGILTADDFRNYRVKWREPLTAESRGYQILSMPPPSSGGAHVIEILHLLETDPLATFGFQSFRSVHLTASALQQAFADRAKYMGDPDFVPVPVGEIISLPYAQRLRGQWDAARARHFDDVHAGELAHESKETTHFSILDDQGNAVSSTQTINGGMGSAVVAPGTGILLNNEMDDFSAKPGAPNLFGALGGQANSIEPGKTPLSSMSPTIVLKDGVPVLAVGAPGGTRIISCVAETLLNYLVYQLPLYESVAAIRFHHQWSPDVLKVDMPGLETSVEKSLVKAGYQVQTLKDAVSCRVMAVAREGETLHGVSDPRDAGSSAGE